jgi:hypothetical protein
LRKYPAHAPKERRKMDELCKRIQHEKDPHTFDQSVKELNDLIDVKYERIHPEQKD